MLRAATAESGAGGVERVLSRRRRRVLVAHMGGLIELRESDPSHGLRSPAGMQVSALWQHMWQHPMRNYANHGEHRSTDSPANDYYPNLG